MLAFFWYRRSMMTVRIPILLLFTLLAGLVGCSGKHAPAAVIPGDRFAEIYLDLLEHGVTGGDTTAASLPKSTMSILRKWGATAEQFRNTVAYFNENPEEWREFFGGVIRKGEERAVKALEDQTAKVKDQK